MQNLMSEMENWRYGMMKTAGTPAPVQKPVQPQYSTNQAKKQPATVGSGFAKAYGSKSNKALSAPPAVKDSGPGQLVNSWQVPKNVIMSPLENPEDFGLNPNGNYQISEGPGDRYIMDDQGSYFYTPAAQVRAEGANRQYAAREARAPEPAAPAPAPRMPVQQLNHPESWRAGNHWSMHPVHNPALLGLDPNGNYNSIATDNSDRLVFDERTHDLYHTPYEVLQRQQQLAAEGRPDPRVYPGTRIGTEPLDNPEDFGLDPNGQYYISTGPGPRYITDGNRNLWATDEKDVQEMARRRRENTKEPFYPASDVEAPTKGWASWWRKKFGSANNISQAVLVSQLMHNSDAMLGGMTKEALGTAATSAIGAGIGGLAGYLLGRKDDKLFSTLTGAGLGALGGYGVGKYMNPSAPAATTTTTTTTPPASTEVPEASTVSPKAPKAPLPVVTRGSNGNAANIQPGSVSYQPTSVPDDLRYTPTGRRVRGQNNRAATEVAQHNANVQLQADINAVRTNPNMSEKEKEERIAMLQERHAEEIQAFENTRLEQTLNMNGDFHAADRMRAMNTLESIWGSGPKWEWEGEDGQAYTIAPVEWLNSGLGELWSDLRYIRGYQPDSTHPITDNLEKPILQSHPDEVLPGEYNRYILKSLGNNRFLSDKGAQELDARLKAKNLPTTQANVEAVLQEMSREETEKYNTYQKSWNALMDSIPRDATSAEDISNIVKGWQGGEYDTGYINEDSLERFKDYIQDAMDQFGFDTVAKLTPDKMASILWKVQQEEHMQPYIYDMDTNLSPIYTPYGDNWNPYTTPKGRVESAFKPFRDYMTSEGDQVFKTILAKMEHAGIPLTRENTERVLQYMLHHPSNIDKSRQIKGPDGKLYYPALWYGHRAG